MLRKPNRIGFTKPAFLALCVWGWLIAVSTFLLQACLLQEIAWAQQPVQQAPVQAPTVQQTPIQQTLPIFLGEPYTPKEILSGELRLVGSTTMSQLAAVWADGFQRIHPDVKIVIECEGSQTATSQLSQNQLQKSQPSDRAVIGLFSRPLDPEELNKLQPSLESNIISLTICHDPLGVIVHPENPIEYFVWDEPSQQLLSPNGQPIGATWGQAGLSNAWLEESVTLHTRDDASGTRAVLEKWLLSSTPPAQETTAPKVLQHETRSKVIQSVAGDRGGIGLVSLALSGLGDVRLVPIQTGEGLLIVPSRASIDSNQYPLVRPLSIALVAQTKSLSTQPLLKEFIDYITSNFGQADVVKDGFLPLRRSELLIQKDKISEELER